MYVVGTSTMLSSSPQEPNMVSTTTKVISTISTTTTTTAPSPFRSTDTPSEFTGTLLPSQSTFAVTILPTRTILLTSSDLDSLATPSLIPALQNTIEIHSTTETFILPTTSNVMSTPLVTRRPVPRRSSPQNTIIIATSTSTAVIILFIALSLIAIVIIVLILRRKKNKNSSLCPVSIAEPVSNADPIQFNQNECYSSFNQSDYNRQEEYACYLNKIIHFTHIFSQDSDLF